MHVRKLSILAVSVLVTYGCGSSSPATPTPGGAFTDSAAPSGAFAIRMPLDLSDAANSAYGLWPYGVHGGGHASDGHPGWDIEYRPGSAALAAADGVVQSIAPATTPGAVGVQLTHTRGGRTYRTVYQNIGSLGAGIAVGASVRAGQSIGVPMTQTLMMGSSSVTFAMIHFQVDDFDSPPGGLTNPNAVGPDGFLDVGGRAAFDVIWSGASYNQELCEPFPSNPRGAGFPLTRAWTRHSGSGVPRVEFTRLNVNSSDYEYRFFDEGGIEFERGTLQLSTAGRPPVAAALQPSGVASRRMVLYDIVGDTMVISISGPGGAPPSSLAGAPTYRTTR
jgi:murein DD-endopeptidase MepM/ murein hydrolase activator NlpD